jgi:hypothetical protein
MRKKSFTVIIDVPNLAAKEHRQLSTAMRRASFVPVAENFGRRNASFRYQSQLPIVDIINKVAAVASGVGKQYSFTVMKSKA